MLALKIKQDHVLQCLGSCSKDFQSQQERVPLQAIVTLLSYELVFRLFLLFRQSKLLYLAISTHLHTRNDSPQVPHPNHSPHPYHHVLNQQVLPLASWYLLISKTRLLWWSAPCIRKYCAEQQVSMMTARPRSVLIWLNFRKPRRLSETVKRTIPRKTKQKEELTVRSYRARQFMVYTARMAMQGTKMILLGSLSHSIWQLPSRASPITMYAAHRSRRQNFFITFTCSPMRKPTMQRTCAAMKKRVPIMKADIQLDMRRRSPTRERAMPASMTRGTRCWRALFLSWMQMIMRMMGSGFSNCRGKMRKPSPKTYRSATTMMAKWRRGSYFRRLPLFNLCTSFFLSIMLLISWV